MMTCKRLCMAALLLAMLFSSIIPVSAAETAPVSKNDKSVVRVGWFFLSGFQEKDNDGCYGYNYDYLMEIANYAGWKYEFVQADKAACMEMLKNGEIDILGTMLPSPEFDKIYNFSQLEYGHTYSTLFTHQTSSLEPYDYDRLNGIDIGIMKSSSLLRESLSSLASDNGFVFNAVEFNTIDELKAAVREKRVAAGVTVGDVSKDNFKIVAQFNPKPIYFAVPENEQDVLVALNRAIIRIKIDNPFCEVNLHKKHFSIENLKLSETEQELIKATRDNPITVGVIENGAPICSRDSDSGEYQGILIDLMRLISEKTGLAFTFVPVDLGQLGKLGNDPEKALGVKLLLGAVDSKKNSNKRGMLLTDSLLAGELITVCRKGDELSSDRKSKTVALLSTFKLGHEFVAAAMPGYKVIDYPTFEHCLDAVRNGETDTAVYLRTCVNHLLQRPRYENLMIHPTYFDNVFISVAAVSRDYENLIRIINKGLRQVSAEDNRRILVNSTVLNTFHLSPADMVYKYRYTAATFVGLGSLVCLILFVYFRNKKEAVKKLEIAYKEKEEALTAAQLASNAKGNFMSRMSHEIRTPLNAVIGYNTIAQNELHAAKSEPEYKNAVIKVMDCLTKSEIASKHLLGIINDVLDMAAIESGKITVLNEKFDFKGLLSSITTVFYSQARSKKVNLEVIIDTMVEEWFVGDQMRVNQVLTNLLSNAIKFTPEKGKVTLTVKVDVEDDIAHAHFTVQDTGIGMTKEYLKRIWTPFEQADSSISKRFGGTGLGLSITKTLVDLMKGNITVESEHEKGTAFHVDLKFGRTTQPKNSDTFDSSSMKALVVDDDLSTCNYIGLLLTRCGVRNNAVTTGKDAVEAVHEAIANDEPFTICLVDWQMPDMDGIEIVTAIREIVGTSVPIIIVTAYDYSEIAEKAHKAGVDQFLAKPLFQSTLFDVLVKSCGHNVPAKLERNSEIDFSGRRIILAEDNVMNMEIATNLLASVGLIVDSVWNGQEAAEKFEASSSGYYSAILMDVHMPVMDGYSATRRIRSSGHPEASTMPIIAMTADAFAENVSEALEAGMNDHVAKPIDIPSLYAVLKKHLEQKPE